MVFDNDFFNNSPLNQMGNNFAENSPFGGGSQFYSNNCGDFTKEVFYGVTDYNALIFLLKEPQNKLFDWRDYSKISIEPLFTPQDPLYPFTIPDVKTDHPVIIDINSPVQYEENGAIKQGQFDQAILNKRICFLDPSYGYTISIDAKERKLTFAIIIFYENTSDKRKNVKDIYIDITKFDIDSQYRAIQLVTSNVSLFYNFIKAIGGDSGSKLLGYLMKEYKEAHRTLNKTDPEAVNWFYNNTPDLILRRPNEDFGFEDQSGQFVFNVVSKEDLWQDLVTLLHYDKSSWLLDSSNNMIRVVQAIQAIDPTYLYDKFYKDPQLIKLIYENLGGEGLDENGMPSSNRTIFAAMLTALTYDHHLNKNQSLSSNIYFKIDEKHRVDSNILWGDRADKFTLQQQEMEVGLAPFLDIAFRTENWTNLSEPHNLHPLDLVYLSLAQKGQKSVTIPFPAIMVKNMAENNEWEEVMQDIRTITNVIAIIAGAALIVSSGGLAVSFAAQPLLTIVAVADIGIAGIDLLATEFKEELKKWDLGRQFLVIWDDVYAIGGIALAIVSIPDLLKGLFSAGAGLIKLGGQLSAKAMNLIKTTVVKIILEINIRRGLKVAKNGVEIGGDLLKQISEVHFVPAAVDRLEGAGVIFARIKDEQGTIRYAAYYKGEELVEATTEAKELQTKLDGVRTKSGQSLEDALDGIILDNISRNMNRLRLTKLEFDEWVKVIQRAGGNVRYADESKDMIKYFQDGNVGASFDAKAIPPTIWVRRGDITDLERFHESMHFEDFLRRGKEDYLQGMERTVKEITGVGAKSQIPKRDQLISKYIKEKYVLDKILEEQAAFIKKHGYERFTPQEIDFSNKYFIKEYLVPCLKFGIDMTKITIKK